MNVYIYYDIIYYDTIYYDIIYDIKSYDIPTYTYIIPYWYVHPVSRGWPGRCSTHAGRVAMDPIESLPWRFRETSVIDSYRKFPGNYLEIRWKIPGNYGNKVDEWWFWRNFSGISSTFWGGKSRNIFWKGMGIFYQQKMEGVYYLHLDSTHKPGELTKIPCISMRLIQPKQLSDAFKSHGQIESIWRFIETTEGPKCKGNQPIWGSGIVACMENRTPCIWTKHHHIPIPSCDEHDNTLWW